MRIPKKNSHAYLVEQIKKFLDHIPSVFIWKQWQGEYSKKGVSDFIGIKKVSVEWLRRQGIMEVGLFLAIEAKEGKDTLSDEQKDFLEMVVQFGGVGIEARNLDDLEGLK